MAMFSFINILTIAEIRTMTASTKPAIELHSSDREVTRRHTNGLKFRPIVVPRLRPSQRLRIESTLASTSRGWKVRLRKGPGEKEISRQPGAVGTNCSIRWSPWLPRQRKHSCSRDGYVLPAQRSGRRISGVGLDREELVTTTSLPDPSD